MLELWVFRPSFFKTPRTRARLSIELRT